MPIMKGKQLLLVFLFGAYALLQASANIYETDDAVIIEGKCSYFFPSYKHTRNTINYVSDLGTEWWWNLW